jgi:hypothetical protein
MPMALVQVINPELAVEVNGFAALKSEEAYELAYCRTNGFLRIKGLPIVT